MSTSGAPESVGEQLAALVARARVFDLGHPLEPTMPISPNHPGYRMALLRRHGDMVRPDGGSAANEMIVMGGHTGTHFDALCHVSHQGKLHGGIDAASAQTQGSRFSQLGVETVEPIVCRGVLLDIAAARGVDVLAPGEPITAGDLAAAAERAGVEVGAGDAVLVRSGWARYWDDPPRYIGHDSGVPGPEEDAARWLADRGILVTAHDSMAYEHLPPGSGHRLLPVHRILLVEAGVFIIENANMEALAAAGVCEFLFSVSPLPFVGGTGSPVRPVAVA